MTLKECASDRAAMSLNSRHRARPSAGVDDCHGCVRRLAADETDRSEDGDGASLSAIERNDTRLGERRRRRGFGLVAEMAAVAAT